MASRNNGGHSRTTSRFWATYGQLPPLTCAAPHHFIGRLRNRDARGFTRHRLVRTDAVGLPSHLPVGREIMIVQNIDAITEWPYEDAMAD